MKEFLDVFGSLSVTEVSWGMLGAFEDAVVEGGMFLITD
jgi:hypothetical protein